MESPEGRTLSGRALVVVGVAAAVVFGVGGAAVAPALQERVRQEQHPRTLREPIDSGTLDGQVWEAVARFDGSDNCVELRYRAEVVERACAAADTGEPLQGVRGVALGDDLVVLIGVAAESVGEVVVEPTAGAPVTAPVRADELGFPVGFFATELPAGTKPDRVVALDADGDEIAAVRPGG